MSDQRSVADSALAEFIAMFRTQKKLAEKAMAQVSDANLRRPLNADTNSIAVIVKHMAGNMVSRWTDFLTSDGEKPWRKRDGEFVDDFSSTNSREEIMVTWERGWKVLFETMQSLKPEDLGKEVKIRGEAQSVVRAIIRQIDHYGYHIGQIVLIARVLTVGEKWEVLSIPRGGSEEYNRRVWGRG